MSATELPGVTLYCNADGCEATVEGDHSNRVPYADAIAALAVCAAALGWRVGAPYSSPDSHDLCPEHRR